MFRVAVCCAADCSINQYTHGCLIRSTYHLRLDFGEDAHGDLGEVVSNEVVHLAIVHELVSGARAVTPERTETSDSYDSIAAVLGPVHGLDGGRDS